MRVVVDTNVGVVASGRTPQASASCVKTCAEFLRDLQLSGVIVLDDGWEILREYIRQLKHNGQPDDGTAFLKWVLSNQANRLRCETVRIVFHEDRGFAEFPEDDALMAFDRSDRKFVAVAVSHLQRPPIVNAVDSDWWEYQTALEGHGVRITQLCPDAVPC